MTFEAPTEATPGEGVEIRQRIVVAVDGSDRNRSAIHWAANEAAAAGCELELVTAVQDHASRVPHFSVHSQDQRAHDMLEAIRQDLLHVVTEQEVRTHVAVGKPVEVLLDRARNARSVVVGKRGLGSFSRMIVGSTSIEVAGRAEAPVTIVPDGWAHEDHQGSSVVLGIDPYLPERPPIQLAFSRADRLRVPVVAVHGWEAPTVYSGDAPAVAGTLTELEQEARTEFDRVLESWKQEFPDAESRAVHADTHPAMAVLTAAQEAQLVVLGRHGGGKPGGFAFGSVTRAVLHYADCPVMVVPADPLS